MLYRPPSHGWELSAPVSDMTGWTPSELTTLMFSIKAPSSHFAPTRCQGGQCCILAVLEVASRAHCHLVNEFSGNCSYDWSYSRWSTFQGLEKPKWLSVQEKKSNRKNLFRIRLTCRTILLGEYYGTVSTTISWEDRSITMHAYICWSKRRT